MRKKNISIFANSRYTISKKKIYNENIGKKKNNYQ